MSTKCKFCGKELSFVKTGHYYDKGLFDYFPGEECCFDCYLIKVGDNNESTPSIKSKRFKLLKLIFPFLNPILPILFCYYRLTAGMREEELVTLFFLLNIPYVMFFYTIIFFNKKRLLNSLKYTITPDIISTARGEKSKDRYWSALLVLPILISIPVVFIEYIITLFLFTYFK